MSFFDQIDFKKILDLNWIFEKTPDAQGLYVYLSVLFSLFLVAALILWRRATKTRGTVREKLYGQFFKLFMTTGLIGLALIFLRFEGIAYLGSRLIMFILLGISLIWALMITYYGFFILPKEVKELAKKEEFEKYLPSQIKDMVKDQKSK